MGTKRCINPCHALRCAFVVMEQPRRTGKKIDDFHEFLKHGYDMSNFFYFMIFHVSWVTPSCQYSHYHVLPPVSRRRLEMSKKRPKSGTTGNLMCIMQSEFFCQYDQYHRGRQTQRKIRTPLPMSYLIAVCTSSLSNVGNLELEGT